MAALAVFMFGHALSDYFGCTGCSQSLIQAVYWGAFALCVAFAWLPWILDNK